MSQSFLSLSLPPSAYTCLRFVQLLGATLSLVDGMLPEWFNKANQIFTFTQLTCYLTTVTSHCHELLSELRGS